MLIAQRDRKTKQLDVLIKLFYAAVPTGLESAMRNYLGAQ